MSYLKIPFLLGALAITALSTQAQNAQNSDESNRVPTAAETFAELVRKSATQPGAANLNAAATAAAAANMGASQAVSSDRTRRNGNRGQDHYNNNYQNGTIYYGVPSPYYPYPYGAPAYNNYYYPAQPTTTIVSPPIYSWSRPATITSVPLGTYYNGYPAQGYPAPGYPAYPAPGYGYPSYPVPNYGYPTYPGLPYPAYGTNTYVYGSGNGSLYSQSQNSGYGISLGNGGLSVQFGNRRSSSSTIVTRY